MAAPRIAGVELTGPAAVASTLSLLADQDDRFSQVDPNGNVVQQLTAFFGAGGAEVALLQLIRSTAVLFDEEIYRALPILRPYSIRDRSMRKNATNGQEMWGTPDASGYFSDDNSLLKRVPWPLPIRSQDARFDGMVVRGGWTCCHAWRSLPRGGQASRYGLLNSFSPVLVWLPSKLASPTDVEGSAAQCLLKAMAMSFRAVEVPEALSSFTESAWNLLVDAGGATIPAPVTGQHHFSHSERFVAKRLESIEQAASVLQDTTIPIRGRFLGRRYAAGLASVLPARRRALSEALLSYAAAVGNSQGIRDRKPYVPLPGPSTASGETTGSIAVHEPA